MLDFTKYYGELEKLSEELPKGHKKLAANLKGAIAEIEASGTVPEGLEDVTPTSYTIQPLKVEPRGGLYIYVGKGEIADLGESFPFHPLRTTRYKVIWDESQNRVVRRVFDTSLQIPLLEGQALFSVNSIFGITETLEHFFVAEGFRGRREAVDKFIQEASIYARKEGIRALYLLRGEAKAVDREWKGKRFRTFSLEVIGHTNDKHLAKLLELAYRFVNDYISYRREKARLAFEQITPVETEGGETEGIEEAVEELNKF